MALNEKKRKPKTSLQQIEIYVDFIEINRDIVTGTMDPRLPPDHLDNKWTELVAQLNSCGNGPKMTIDEWKKRFIDYKNNVRAKARNIKIHSQKTGGGETSCQILSPLEERAITVWGRVAVYGSPDIPAGGFVSNVSPLTLTPEGTSLLKSSLRKPLKKRSPTTDDSENMSRLVELKEKRLKFDILSFKYLHPGFTMMDDDDE